MNLKKAKALRKVIPVDWREVSYIEGSRTRVLTPHCGRAIYQRIKKRA